MEAFLRAAEAYRSYATMLMYRLLKKRFAWRKQMTNITVWRHEHFATYCKTGKKSSQQVKQYVRVGITIAAAGLVAAETYIRIKRKDSQRRTQV